MAVHARQTTNADLRYDFGSVKQGETVAHTFTIRAADTTIPIERIELPHPGMKARFTRRASPAGTHAVTVTWNTERLSGPTAGDAVVTWADSALAPVTLAISGTVRPVLTVLPYPAVYFSVYADQQVEQSVTIVNNDDAPLEVVGLEPQGHHFTASVRTVTPGAEYQIAITVPRGTPMGRYRESLIVQTTHALRSRVSIAVNVLVKPDLFVDPEAIDLGTISLDDLRRNPTVTPLLSQTVIVSRRGGPFEIAAARIGHPGLRVEQSPTGEASAVFRFDVELDPSKLSVGPLVGELLLETSDPESPRLLIPVRGEIR